MLIGTATFVAPIPSVLHFRQPQRGHVLPNVLPRSCGGGETRRCGGGETRSGGGGETRGCGGGEMMAANSGEQPGPGLTSGYPNGFIHEEGGGDGGRCSSPLSKLPGDLTTFLTS
jgi:hypothetical protein